MPKKQKRYTDKLDLVSDINVLKRKAIKLRKDSEAVDADADNFFKYGLGDQGRDKRAEAEGMREAARRIEEVKLVKLSRALAEFNTDLLPGMGGDNGVVIKSL